ncbi:MAG TPA: hypothetical protein VMS88_05670 [Terriglobales bacterium]|nr:hypothetical protein [Terriglobales bacterium]
MRHFDSAPRTFIVLLASLLLLAYWSSAAGAACNSQSPCIPPTTGCGYSSTCDVFFANGVEYKNLAVHDFSWCVMVMPGQTNSGGFDCKVDAVISWDSGNSWTAYTDIPALAWMTFIWGGTGSQGEDLYTAQLTQLDASGGGLPGAVRLRESPVQNSNGQASVLLVGNEYQIDSFFDVFFEISLDDGLTWAPSLSSCHVVLGPRGPVPARHSTWGATKTLYR